MVADVVTFITLMSDNRKIYIVLLRNCSPEYVKFITTKSPAPEEKEPNARTQSQSRTHESSRGTRRADTGVGITAAAGV